MRGIYLTQMEVNMSRLKELGTWILIVIVFYIFSNIMINIALEQRKEERKIYNQEVVNQIN